MIKRVIFSILCAGIFFAAASPPPAHACPLICHYVNGHWVCGCSK